MSIRKRLLWLLFPPLFCFMTLVSAIFYYFWANEIQCNITDPYLAAQKLNHAVLAVVLVTLATAALVTALVIYISGNISRPLRNLNNAALDIAAGDYEEPIHVVGPQEFIELSNTLNTMRECLEENMYRLKENSTARERLYGEYECALLLQQQMFEKACENYQNAHLKLHPLKITTTGTTYGMYLHLADHTIGMQQTQEAGFQGIYELLSHHAQQSFPHATITFDEDYSSADFSTNEMPLPIIWKGKTNEILKGNQRHSLEKGDLIFLMNRSLLKHFMNEDEIAEWLKKLLKHFSVEGMELFMTMLTNQLNFLVKKHHVEQDIYLLVIQLY